MKFSFLLLFSVILSSLSLAIGISPPYYIIDFEPGLEESFSHFALNNLDEPITVELNSSGALSPYIEFEDDDITIPANSKVEIFYTLKLPDKLPPGKNKAYISVLDATQRGGGFFTVKSSVEAAIVVNVPYPGRYAELKLSVPDIREGQPLHYTVTLENKGDEMIEDAVLNVQISDVNDERTIHKVHENIDIAVKGTNSIEGYIDDVLDKGVYVGVATLDFGNSATVEKTFRVGSYELQISNYTKTLYHNQINPMDITIRSNWNDEIKEVYATVEIEGKVHRSLAKDVKKFGDISLTAYIDDPSLTLGVHQANITVFYGDGETSKIVDFSVITKPVVEEPSGESFVSVVIKQPTTYLLLAVLLLVAINIFLILRKKK